jgi:hypothetical protein
MFRSALNISASAYCLGAHLDLKRAIYLRLTPRVVLDEAGLRVLGNLSGYRVTFF